MTRKITVLSVLFLVLAACGSPATETERPAAPAFTLPDALGGEVSLNDYGGRNLLLYFHMAVG